MPALGAAIAVIVELGLGIALLVGWQARWSALIMAAFTIAAALCFHRFWAAPADQQMMQNIQFFRSIAIAGGLLFVFAFGPSAYSLDARSSLGPSQCANSVTEPCATDGALEQPQRCAAKPLLI